MKTLNEIIGQAKLTKVGKIIADYVMAHTTESCFMTSTELASTLGISEASIIRFTRTIGFKGYMDFQKYLQTCHLATLTKVSGQVTAPSERFMQATKEYPDNLHFGIEALKIADASLRSVFSMNGNELFNEVIELILQADKIYIVSSRSNVCLGSRLYFLLKQVLPNVYTTGLNTGTVIDHMCDITENDCLILFSFPRYSVIDQSALQMAHDVNAKIILITDVNNEHLPTFSDLADKILRVDIDSNSYFASQIGVNFLIELIGNGVSRKIGAPVQERLKHVEHYLSQFELT